MSKFIALLCAVSMALGTTVALAAETESNTSDSAVAVTETEAPTETATEAATEAAAETATETATEVAAETATEAATEAATETATETATEAATETATEAATEVATETATEAPVAGGSALVFTDVPEDAYYAEAVAYCAEKGLFNGTSDDEFSPSITMTRGMFATVFGRLQNADLENAKLTYSDVAADAYYAPYIAWATEQGIMDGYDDDNFGPDDAITREQAAKMLYAYLTNVAKVTLTESAAEYTDSANVSDWAAEAVAANAAVGYLLANENGNINPTAELTRADACYAVAATVKLAEAQAVTDDADEVTVADTAEDTTDVVADDSTAEDVNADDTAVDTAEDVNADETAEDTAEDVTEDVTDDSVSE